MDGEAKRPEATWSEADICHRIAVLGLAWCIEGSGRTLCIKGCGSQSKKNLQGNAFLVGSFLQGMNRFILSFGKVTWFHSDKRIREESPNMQQSVKD